MNLSIIKTERLELIPITEELCHAELSSPILLGTMLGSCIPHTWPPDLATKEVVYEFINLLTHSGGSRFFAYYWIKSDHYSSGQRVLVGSGGFILGDDNVPELGYSVLNEFRGFGYATEAVRAMIEWGFNFLDFPSIYAATFPEGIASKRVLEKTGFIFSGSGKEPGTIAYILQK